MTAPTTSEAWRQLIPHRGAMSLIERIGHWDQNAIRCHADNHRDPRHPLRAHGRLAMICAIEYAAQAMAIHGALRHQRARRPKAGFITALRGVNLAPGCLSDVTQTLDIHTTYIAGDEQSCMYEYSVAAADDTLLTGRATVFQVFDDEG